MKRTKGTVTLVGVAIILLAAVIILLSVFVPRLQQKKQMKELLRAATSPDIAVMALNDPLFDHGDLLGNKGKEVELTGEARGQMQAALGALLDAGFRAKGAEKSPFGTSDLSLYVRGASGDTVRLYFTAEEFYYQQGSAIARFAPKDAEAYGELYTLLQALIQEK